MSRPRTSYVEYNSSVEVDALNQNDIIGPFVTMPNALYGGDAVPSPQITSYCGDLPNSYPRDTRFDYVFTVDRKQHPDNFSHFMYPGCANGYCMGVWPGRFATSPLCCSEGQGPSGSRTVGNQPKDMAPARFYGVSPFQTDNGAYQRDRSYGTVPRRERPI